MSDENEHFVDGRDYVYQLEDKLNERISELEKNWLEFGDIKSWKKAHYGIKDEIADLKEQFVKLDNKYYKLVIENRNDIAELREKVDKFAKADEQNYIQWVEQLNELKEQLRLEVDMRITNTKTLNRFLNDWANKVKNNKEVLRELRIGIMNQLNDKKAHQGLRLHEVNFLEVLAKLDVGSARQTVDHFKEINGKIVEFLTFIVICFHDFKP